jgi:hypothetical protein
MTAKKRLVTKCDIDGLASGILLKEMDLVDQIAFCHPRDIEKGTFEINDDDITAGLPYRESVHLAFDYYSGRAAGNPANLIVDKNMRSTSGVIYNHYGKQNFQNVSQDLLKAVDKGISADISMDEILYPTGWILLTYLIDQRTGLANFSRFSMSDAELIANLTDWCRENIIWEILNLSDVEERLDLYFSCIDSYKSQILKCSSLHSNLVVVDLREENVIYPGNRFMTYALFPESNVSLQIMRHPSGLKTAFSVGKSFIDRSFTTDIGKIMKANGGGGHKNAGACEVDNERAADVLKNLIKALKYGTFKNLFMGYHNYYYP